MNKPTAKNETPGYPEFGVRREVICNFFSPPMPPSTFHDRVNEGIIVPIKSMRGFYKLNDSLRRLGLREVPKLPFEVPARTPEEIIRLAFCGIDPEVFESPTWQLNVEAIDASDLHHALSIVALHDAHVALLPDERTKRGYMQGVLDAAFLDSI